jgi:hypothetical protein
MVETRLEVSFRLVPVLSSLESWMMVYAEVVWL